MENKRNYFDQTGSHSVNQNISSLNYPLGQFMVKVQVNENNQFVGISEVSVNKQFVDSGSLSSNKGFKDIEEYYKEK
ncbi:MAG TPA: hypothetical protein VK179_19445 [Bacteroidales bacterium]|nr:hypothetical protein [Bacteroidales bacterium]